MGQPALRAGSRGAQAGGALAFALFTLGGSRFEPELQPKDYTLAAIERIATFVDDHRCLELL